MPILKPTLIPILDLTGKSISCSRCLLLCTVYFFRDLFFGVLVTVLIANTQKQII